MGSAGLSYARGKGSSDLRAQSGCAASCIRVQWMATDPFR
ncbi:hypothetical protein [Azospirillum largimobile]